MDGTLDSANFNWGRILNSNKATQTVRKFRILPYFEIFIRSQNLKFQVICQKMAVFEQLNDQVLNGGLKIKFDSSLDRS